MVTFDDGLAAALGLHAVLQTGDLGLEPGDMAGGTGNLLQDRCQGVRLDWRPVGAHAGLDNLLINCLGLVRRRPAMTVTPARAGRTCLEALPLLTWPVRGPGAANLLRVAWLQLALRFGVL